MSGSAFRARAQRFTKFAWNNKYRLVIGAGLLYSSSLYATLWLAAKRRDRIHDNTFLYWRVFPGSIVEERTPRSTLDLLLSTSDRSFAEEPPRVLTIYEVREALEWAATDPSIIGLVADFSSATWPNVPHESLGLAQIEELHGAITTLKNERKRSHESLPSDEQQQQQPFRTVAVTDTFHSQPDYVLATAFDEVFVQQTGEVPLTGLGATIPFYARLIQWLGINVHAEARTDWKSMVAPYTQERLTPAQREDELQLLNDLNDNLCTLVARARFPSLPPAEALDKVKSLTKKGPYSATKAKQLGLITDVKYKREVVASLLGQNSTSSAFPALQAAAGATTPPSATASLASLDLQPEPADKHMFGLFHYHRVATKQIEKSDALLADVGVVYLLGTIGGDASSEFGTASVLRGLKEAAKSEEISALVLRVDSGGGGVVESDAIWDAVREVRDSGKVIVASFGNAAASGGYLAAAGADLIVCAPSTVTGSIGVASLRPNITPTLLERLKLTVEQFYLGSKSRSLLHELEGEELQQHREHIDETYEMFKKQVCDGRNISQDSIEYLAGGRVYTGLRAFEMLEPEHKKGAILAQQNHVFNSYDAEGEQQIEDKQDGDTQSQDQAAEVPQDADSPSSPMAGPLGRGLTDGFGGLYDAAYAAFGMSLDRALLQIKSERPALSDIEVIQTVLPELDFVGLGDGAQAQAAIGVRLRTFPEEKSLWDSIKETARRGESIDPTMLQAQAAVLLRAVLTSVASSGLQQTCERLGVSSKGLGGGVSSMRVQNSSRDNVDLH